MKAVFKYLLKKEIGNSFKDIEKSQMGVALPFTLCFHLFKEPNEE
jgi:hypothetical protein